MSERRVVLVEYFTTDDAVFVFGVNAAMTEPDVVELRLNRAQLQRFLQSWRSAWRDSPEATANTDALPAGYTQPSEAELAELWLGYNALVEPLVRWAERDDIAYLVPHGLLHYLPLHALQIQGEYLIERNPVLYLPSASVLKYCTVKRRSSRDIAPRRASAVVFGNPTADLPFARAEAQQVAALFGVEPLLDGAASLDAFRNGIRETDIVHFAGHGYFDAEDPLASALLFAGGQRLTARDVFALNGLAADLVTLSGCETGISGRRRGDELMGLTRAFLYAGTPSVLVSLWQVADDSTAFFMQRFYHHVRGSPALHKVDALRSAILETAARPDWNALYHWAPFMLVGDWH